MTNPNISKERLTAMSTTTISIYTDGSYKNKKGGYPFVFDI